MKKIAAFILKTLLIVAYQGEKIRPRARSEDLGAHQHFFSHLNAF